MGGVLLVTASYWVSMVYSGQAWAYSGPGGITEQDKKDEKE